jgi:hypothetical protein
MEEFSDIDITYFKIIESWKLIRSPMVEEMNNMSEEKARVRVNTIEMLDGVVNIAQNQRLCLSDLAMAYNLKPIEPDIKEYDPVSTIEEILSPTYMSALNTKMDNFIQTIDTKNLFMKREITISGTQN